MHEIPLGSLHGPPRDSQHDRRPCPRVAQRGGWSVDHSLQDHLSSTASRVLPRGQLVVFMHPLAMAALVTEPELEGPPAYAPTDPAHPTQETSQAVEGPTSTTDCRTYKIYNTSAGLNVTVNEQQLYYVGRYEVIDTPDIIVYGGYDQSGPQLALVQFVKFDKNFKLYLGGLKHPAAHDWDTVRLATEGRFITHNFWRFELPPDPSVPDSKRRRVQWTKTHDSKLRASKFSIRDYKLVHEADDEILAVYTEHSLGTPGALKGKLEFRQRLGDNAELAALTVVMALLEKMRRTLRQGGRAVPNGWVIK